MKQFRQIVKQSFVNPIIDFMPLIVFTIIDNFWGMMLGFYIAIPLSLGLVIYFFIKESRIFNWHAIVSFFLLTIGFLIVLVSEVSNVAYRQILVEAVSAIVLLAIVVVQKPVKRYITKKFHSIPMENNIDEFFRVTFLFVIVFMLHVLTYIIFKWGIDDIDNVRSAYYIRSIYVVLLGLLILYECGRVYFIRTKLFVAEWFPIVNIEGNVVGTIERSASILAARKYMHPVVRVTFTSGNKLLLRKRREDDDFFSDVWDATVSAHVRYGETVEHCLTRMLQEALDYTEVDQAEYCYNYTCITKVDREAIFFFVVSLPDEQQLELSPDYGKGLKWWTMQQIDDNIDTNIFSDSFMKEYAYMYTKGLIKR